MKPAGTDQQQLLAWAAAIIARECEAGTFGKIEIHMEGGRIVRARSERSEKPPTPSVKR